MTPERLLEIEQRLEARFNKQTNLEAIWLRIINHTSASGHFNWSTHLKRCENQYRSRLRKLRPDIIIIEKLISLEMKDGILHRHSIQVPTQIEIKKQENKIDTLVLYQGIDVSVKEELTYTEYKY